MAARTKLTLAPYLRSRRSGEPVAYEVRGLPEGFTVMVAKFGQWWQIIVQTAETSGEWVGKFVSPEDALNALQRT